MLDNTVYFVFVIQSRGQAAVHPELRHHFVTADAIATLFAPHVEVVIHDIGTRKIAYIANNYSGRAIGDPSSFNTTEFFDANTDTPIGPYQKVNWDGRQIRSVSSVLQSVSGEAIGMLCINLDLSDFSRIQQVMQDFISPARLHEQPDALFKEDWHEKINLYIQGWVNDRGLRVDSLSRQQKRLLIEDLSGNGAFSGKNSAQYIARILKVSRATVYNYLKEIKQQ